MAKIYKNQSALRLVLDTDISLVDASTLEIKATKPDGEVITLTASLTGTDSMYYDFTDTLGESELDVSGLWRFWAKVTFADGRISYGEPALVMVYEESN